MVYTNPPLDCGKTQEAELNGKTNDKKIVTFDIENSKILVMRVWLFAARQSRVGHWQNYAIDRERFKTRIARVAKKISWIFESRHRIKINNRIMKLTNKPV
ncbi:unknown [Choristoneura occidentalis granulovirus]|uniref:Uncharacterized protein n=2 Tax=Betabaculovirus chofumiferanae TaxID=3051997 RepID=Q8B591_GVCF|nr:unknown [Choristoneura fumiferana granulovirus]AAN77188.1 unknown [Choristoneura fumiferana granulovirus]ABC61170.1 unknown [Choristoneura fumiferana granulovirus]